MNNKFIFTMAMTTLLSGAIFKPVNARTEIVERYGNIQFGYACLESDEDLKKLVGCHINTSSHAYDRIRKLSSEISQTRDKIDVLKEELFEEVALNDKDEKWRYRMFEDFDFDEYISQSPRMNELNELENKINELKRKIKIQLISNAPFTVDPEKRTSSFSYICDPLYRNDYEY